MSYILISILILAVLAMLLFAHRASQKEKLKAEIKSRARRILNRADDIWDALEATGTLIHAPDVVGALLDYYIHELRRREALISSNDTAELIQKAEDYKLIHSNTKIKNELKSDQEINQAKRCFARTSKLLRTALSMKLISNQGCASMRKTLKRRILDLEVDAYERLGDGATRRSDPAVAANYYKFAKKLLIESDLKFEGKNQRVRDITHKTQSLFGNTVKDQLARDLLKESDKTDEHGIPKSVEDLNAKKKNF